MRILLADDEPSIFKLCRQMLEGSGFEVEVAADALDAIRSKTFDLVIPDPKIPKLDGFEVLQTMGKEQLSVPVLVITGHYPDDVIEN